MAFDTQHKRKAFHFCQKEEEKEMNEKPYVPRMPHVICFANERTAVGSVTLSTLKMTGKYVTNGQNGTE